MQNLLGETHRYKRPRQRVRLDEFDWASIANAENKTAKPLLKRNALCARVDLDGGAEVTRRPVLHTRFHSGCGFERSAHAGCRRVSHDNAKPRSRVVRCAQCAVVQLADINKQVELSIVSLCV